MSLFIIGCLYDNIQDTILRSLLLSFKSMATNETRRRLPKLPSTNPIVASSDETPRTVTSDESARQRRRSKQQLARQQTPTGRETVSPSSAKEVQLNWLNTLLLIYHFSCLYHLDRNNLMNDKQPNVDELDVVLNHRNKSLFFFVSLSISIENLVLVPNYNLNIRF